MALAKKGHILIAVTLMTVLLVACSGTADIAANIDSKSIYRNTYVEPKAASAPLDSSEDYDGFAKVGETDALKLFYNKDNDVIEVHNKQSGYVWSSMVDWEGYGYEKPNPIQKATTGSMFAIVYTDIVSNEGKLNIVYTNNEPSKRSFELLENGISLKYEFTMLKMTVVLNITLDGDELELSFPSKDIEEGSRNLLMALQLMPAFGASNHQDSGYILYPDGCGALLRYENYNNRPNNLNSLTWGAYSAYDCDIEDYFLSSGIIKDYVSAAPKYEATMPVFGVKKGDDGYLAYATLGDAQSKIDVGPEGYIVDFNRACFEFQYRNTFEIAMSNITAGSSSNTKEGLKVDKKRMNQDYSVRYHFLSGEDANYSGMAKTYRAYLLENGMLANTASSTVPLALDLFCGITEDRMLIDKFISMTTFDQAEDISQELLDAGVTSQSITLKGWAKNGYGIFPSPQSAAGQLGGNSGLSALMKYATNNNLQLFAQVNPTLAMSSNSGFMVRSDAVYKGNTLAFSDKTGTYYLLSPMAVSKQLMKLNNKLQSLGSIGLSLDGMTRYVYEDYKEDAASMRTATTATWQDILSSLSGPIAAETGNQYALAYADRLYNIPTSSSLTNISDEEVPFYQMVVHGSISYSSNAGNLFYDRQLQKLQWIEFGCMPYFELAYKSADQLKYTTYNRLYTSYYKDWIDDAVSIYKEFNTTLASIWDCAMTEHTRLSEDLVKITYENGTVIYINYGDAPASADGNKIPAKDYIVIN